MVSFEKQLERVHAEEREIREKIDVRNSKREIECKGCGDYHKVGELKALQTHWYEGPHGCMGGDRWHEGELQFVCPETGVVNRLLFDKSGIDWRDRDSSKNPEYQFRSAYKRLFLEVQDTYRDSFGAGSAENNFYVDQNRGKFGLTEKKA